jgi:hypothetical protein
MPKHKSHLSKCAESTHRTPASELQIGNGARRSTAPQALNDSAPSRDMPENVRNRSPISEAVSKSAQMNVVISVC